MPLRTGAALVLPVLALVLQVGAIAQAPRTPTGTGLVVGQVIETTSGQPVDGALVRLEVPNAGPASSRTVMADPQGRFLFRNVAKGSFFISASLDGYIRGGYGKSWPSGQLARLDVEDNARITDLTIRLWKYAAIGGRVVDETGEPVVGVTVRALIKTMMAGRVTLTHDTFECLGACLSQRTDDRGVFRFAQLIPGEYVVVVPSVTSAGPTSFQRLIATLRPGASGPPAHLESGVMGMAWLGGGGWVTPTYAGVRTRDDKVAIGDVDRGAPLASLTEDGQLSIYPTQFYPSAVQLVDAAMIPLASGEERSDINFFLKPSRTVRVSGTLTGPDGPLPDFVLRLVPVGEDLLATDPEVATTLSDVDGSFTFVGVTPGSYFIRMQRRPIARAAPVLAGPFVSSGGGGGVVALSADDAPLATGRVQWAESRISVGDEDVRNVGVVVRDGLRVAGRLEFVGTAPKPARVASLYVERVDGRRSVNLGLSFAAVDDRLRFESQGHIPGRYLLQVPDAPQGWFLRSAMLEGRDVSEVPIDLIDSDVSGIVVTFADKPSSVLSGTVTDAAGAPDGAATVLVFPAAPARWLDGGRARRRFAQSAADRHGVFTVSNLPPGDYLIAALQNPSELLWQDPAMLAKLAQTATKVTIRDGDNASGSVRSMRMAGR